jgi:chemosensory pili system protein ChpA (sensor histidine kinase/response regulator)
MINDSSPEMIELFLQEASEHLQFLREYSGILQDPYPLHEDIERLYISAHGVAGTGGTYGYTLFHEVASKLAQIFHYAMNATISQEIAAPLVEFIYEAIAVLESDLIMISANSIEAEEEIQSFKQRYPFAFQEAQKSESEAAAEPAPAETEPAHAAPEADTPEREATPEPQPVAEEEAVPAATPETEPAPVKESAEPVAVAPKPEAPARIAEAPVAEAVPEIAAPVEPAVELPSAQVAAGQIPPAEPVHIAPEAESPAPEMALEAAPHEEVPEATAEAAAVAPEPVEEPAPVEASAEVQAAAELAPPGEAASEVPCETVAEAAAATSFQSEAAVQPEVVQPDAAPEPHLEAVPAASAAEQAEVKEEEEDSSLETLLHPDPPLPEEVLEFFVPEVEEHLQTITDSLLSLEASPNPEEIHRLFRSMHTIKGSAAQVGASRISTVAHKAEDLLGRMRDGELQPTPGIIDLCLESVDVLKKMIYAQWASEAEFQSAARALFDGLKHAAPEAEQIEAAQIEAEPPATEAPAVVEAPAPEVVPAPEALAIEAQPPAAENLQTKEEPLAAAVEEPLAAAAKEPKKESLVAGEEPKKEPLTAMEIPPAPPAPVAAAPSVPRILEAEVAAAPSGVPVQAGPQQRPAILIKPAEEKEEPKLEGLEWLAAQKPPVGMAQSKSVRIALERLDRMMNVVGELVINRTRMLGRLEELEKLADVLNFSKGRMSDKVTEFQDKYEFSRIGVNPFFAPPAQWRGASLGGGLQEFGGSLSNAELGFGEDVHSEFSELEMDRYDDFGILSRSLTEISADITEVLNQLDSFVRRVDGDIDEFTKLAHRLQDEITQARMVPIGGLFTRITRTVRDAAKASNKKVELTLAGAETELDNNIVQQIADPLLHLVRNAVAHGIESAEERYESGKPDEGHIAVRAYHKGNHIYVEVEDDGRGIDMERVRKTAVEGGFVPAKDADNLGRRELLDLLFRPGFSTAPNRTELAGRGVGLDVVRSNLNSLNGEIEIETEKGIGSRFTLKVPLTLIISQALFVQCGEQTFAFPLGFVEEIRRISPAEIEEVSGKLITRVRDVLTEVVRLDEALQLPALVPNNGYLRLVLVNVGGRQVGVVVEEVLRKDEIVIKSLGDYLRNVKLFPGATIAPDGSLILLVDLNRLIMGESIERRPLSAALHAARIYPPHATVARGAIPAAAEEKGEREKVVVLADDSISVRRFVGRMLEKAGYRVKLASDGLEALEIATSNPCDLVITDLEMPRTNGYELILHLRQTPSTAKVPVMVVTSRAGAKHRDRALKEGAVAFMVKPVQEETFIAQVQELIGSSGQAVAPDVH